MQGLEKRGYFFRFIEKCTILYKDKKKTTRISPKGFLTLETFSKQNKNFIKEKNLLPNRKKENSVLCHKGRTYLKNNKRRGHVRFITVTLKTSI